MPKITLQICGRKPAFECRLEEEGAGQTLVQGHLPVPQDRTRDRLQSSRKHRVLPSGVYLNHPSIWGSDLLALPPDGNPETNISRIFRVILFSWLAGESLQEPGWIGQCPGLGRRGVLLCSLGAGCWGDQWTREGRGPSACAT